MASPSISIQNNQNRGFTLIEVLIGVAILMVILGLGLFIGFDFYRSYAVHSEKGTVISILQKARNQSISNINQTRHGVRFASPLQYIIFECDSTTPQCTDYNGADTSQDIIISPAYGVSVAGIPFDIVFDQLNGDCVSSNCSSGVATIALSDGAKSYDISVNSEGRIDWE